MTHSPPSHAQMHLGPLPFIECGKSHVIVGWFHFDADAVPSQPGCGDAACSGPHERVQNRIAHKGEHSYQSFGEFKRKGGWVFSGGCASECPDLLEVLAVQVFRDDRHDSGREGWATIAARLSLEEDEFDVVLDHRVWLVGFSEKARTIGYFQSCVGDLMPDDWRQVVISQRAATFLDAGVEGENDMASELASRKADIANDDNQASSRHQSSVDAFPDGVNGVQEGVVVCNVSQLIRMLLILLQRPVGRGCDGKMDRVRRQVGYDFSGIA